MEGVHKNIKYTCEQCEDKVTIKGILRVYLNTVHDKVNYLCQLVLQRNFKTLSQCLCLHDIII